MRIVEKRSTLLCMKEPGRWHHPMNADVHVRSLERDGLVLWHLFAEAPPRVEYELTKWGRALLAALVPVNCWIQQNTSNMDRSRRAYDRSTNSDWSFRSKRGRGVRVSRVPVSERSACKLLDV